MKRRKVSCHRCGKLFESSGSMFVHPRYCRPLVVDDPYPEVKVLHRKRLFNADGVGLGAGAAGRREDLGVMVAGGGGEDMMEVTVEEGKTDCTAGEGEGNACVKDSEKGLCELEHGMEWTSEATSEEVVEAMKRVLLDIADAMGAKTTDLFIKQLHHPSLRFEDFKRGVKSHSQLRADADEQVEKELISLRFRKEQVNDTGEEEAAADMWVRDPLDVICRQVATLAIDGKDMNRLILNCDSVKQRGDNGEPVYSHPLSTPLAASVADRVRDRVRTACADDVEGVCGWEDDYDFVLFLQLYSDKSSQTLKTSSQTHFPLHVAVHNTSLTAKENLIRSGDCVVGYMPTSIVWEDEEASIWNEELEDAVSGRGSRHSKLRILQEGLQKCVEPLLSRTLTGFVVRDSTGMPMRCHPVLWSYVTDLPEGWDISSGVHQRCSRCVVAKEDLCKTKPSACKDALTVMMDFDELEREKKRCAISGHTKKALAKVKALKDAMWEKSIAPVRPYLLSLGGNFGVDVFKCLRFELMHNLHLGLTRTMLRCMSERLKTNQLESTEFRYATPPKNLKKFSVIRTAVLRSLNHSMELMDRQSPTIDFKVCFTSNKKTKDLNGLFTDKGLASMLEANDYARVLQVMPFLGATCDRMCGEPGTVTKLFVEYVQLVYTLTRDKVPSIAFSDNDLREVRRRIRKFMGNAHELFGDHQTSDMALPKMHTLMHVADDMKDGGIMAHYRADAHEAGHKIMRNAFEGGSRRGEQGQAEALGKIERATFQRVTNGSNSRGPRVEVVALLSKPRPRARGARTKTKEDAVEGDCAAVTRAREVLHIRDIERFLTFYQGHGCLLRAQTWPNWVAKSVRELVTDLGGPSAFRWFMSALKLKPHDSLKRSKSAYVPGHPCPIPVRNTKGKTILITVDSPGTGDAIGGEVGRELQRVVAAHTFYNTKHVIQNFVMIEAADPVQTQQQLPQSVRDKYASSSVRSVWVAKVLAFLSHKTEGEEVSHKALVQYMDVCHEKKDDVDKALGCVKLRWHQVKDRKDMKEGYDTMRAWYGVVDVETIRGLVHVVRGDYGLGNTMTYECEGDRHWTKRWFYVNRFKLERRGAGTFIEQEEKLKEEEKKLNEQEEKDE